MTPAQEAAKIAAKYVTKMPVRCRVCKGAKENPRAMAIALLLRNVRLQRSLKGSSSMKRRCSMDGAVWLIMVWQGRWHVRQDLPPVLDEEIAKRFAQEQTKMSGQKHRAVEFAVAKP